MKKFDSVKKTQQKLVSYVFPSFLVHKLPSQHFGGRVLVYFLTSKPVTYLILLLTYSSWLSITSSKHTHSCTFIHGELHLIPKIHVVFLYSCYLSLVGDTEQQSWYPAMSWHYQLNLGVARSCPHSWVFGVLLKINNFTEHQLRQGHSVTMMDQIKNRSTL